MALGFGVLQLALAGAIYAGAHPSFEEQAQISIQRLPFHVVKVTQIPESLYTSLLENPPGRDRLRQLLSVFAGDQPTPMYGRYRIIDRGIEFTPAFPLTPGVRYRAVFAPGIGPPISSFFSLPAIKAKSTNVKRVYPTSETLPENLLKFYIHFSAPMSRGGIYQYISLTDSRGKVVELPFLEIDEELWNPEMTRVTLIIDPGRIKRGVKPLEDIGPALETGKRYVLTVSREWRDANGNPLSGDYTKSFHVVKPDRIPIKPSRWILTIPKAGTRTPLTVNMGESMDHALAARLIWVERRAGRIEGKVALSANERICRLTPRGAWTRGTYSLLVATRLEDLAGNNVGKPFEVDAFSTVQRSLTSEVVRRPFRIR